MGTYPYVTSSNTLISGLCWGSGVPPKKIDKTIGIFKAYTTRVGEGPFPTEDHSDYGKKLQKLGSERGSVTGRKRRCGHLDLVLLKYACELCGFDELIMTKWDIIENFEYFKMCDSYVLGGGLTIKSVPFSFNSSPIYTSFSDPKNRLEDIIRFIEEYVGIKIALISNGPNRGDINER
jgi:adenylosuccinate synthase